MLQLTIGVCFFLSSSILSAHALENKPLNSSPAPTASSPLTLLTGSYLASYAQTRGFMLGRPVKAKPSPDGKSVLFLRAQARVPQQSLYSFDVETGKCRELLTAEQVLQGAAEHLSDEEKARRERQRISVGGFTDFQISDDSAQILVSLSGKLYTVNRAGGKIHQLDTGADPIDPKFSPDGKSVSFVRDHDLYVLELATGKSRRITQGGSAILSHALAEFVAQEEMSRFSGYWWSPDSQFIVYEEVDADGVEVWHLSDPEHPGKAPVANFYPRPGKPNVKARLGIIPAAGGDTVWIDWDMQHYPYIAAVNWSKQAPLTLVVASRDQKEVKLLAVDTGTGKTSTLVSETDKDWVNLHKTMPAWLDDGSAFFWISERQGAPQLELHHRDGALATVLAGPGSGFADFVDASAGKQVVYYRAGLDPTESQLFCLPLAGGKPQALTKEKGVHLVTFSHDHSIYVDDASLLDSMPHCTVCHAGGSVIGSLPSVAEEPPVAPKVEFVQLGGAGKFHACLIRPQDFDPARRYPVIVDVYGGPGFNKVLSTRRSFLLDQWLADQGFVIVSIDGRGTPGRGRDFERAICHHFGSLPLDDQVAGVEELAKKFPELDRERIGITGWSFGGYMSALAVLRRPDVFKAAVAGAPVVDWFDYDSCYTERYLGLPETFPDAYKESSLLTYASGLSRPLLLVHGTTDDNVFFRHSLRLADALFRSGREFSILPLSGLTHMVPDPVVMEQLWSRVVQHFHTHLGKPESGSGSQARD
jgi:dipeptidyl-peptidase 4